MITVQAKIRKHLEEYFMLWPQEATAVVERMIAKDDTGLKWDDDLDAPNGYPDQLVAVLFMSAQSEAIEYLEATKPKHFALPLLRGEV